MPAAWNWALLRKTSSGARGGGLFGGEGFGFAAAGDEEQEKGNVFHGEVFYGWARTEFTELGEFLNSLNSVRRIIHCQPVPEYWSPAHCTVGDVCSSRVSWVGF